MNEQNYYDILGVSKSASKDEIKKAYRKLSKQYHPDRNPGDKQAEEKFKQINEAYETLSDDNKKAQYDNPGFGSGFDFSGFSSGGFDPFEAMRSAFGGGGMHGFSSGFNTNKPVQNGQDVHITYNISLTDIYNIQEIVLKYTRRKKCSVCGGKGEKHVCTKCHGTGIITETQVNGNMIFQQQKPCPDCQGTGMHIAVKCEHCHNTGLETEQKEYRINIKNILSYILTRPEFQINIGPYGDDSIDPDGKPGNLVVLFRRSESGWRTTNGIYYIENNNLIYKVNIDVFDMLTGTNKEITLPDNKKIRFKVQKCCKPKQRYMIPNYGLQINNTRDNLIIEINPVYPSDLTEKQVELIEKVKNE